MKLQRFQAWLTGLWAGALLAIGAIAAPSLFAVLDKVEAGKGAGQIFSVEAKVSLAFAVLLFLSERRRVRDLVDAGGAASAMSVNLLVTLGVLFLTVFGEFALHPMIEAAKAGQPTALSFGALHGVSASLYWVKTVLVTWMAWRMTGQQSR